MAAGLPPARLPAVADHEGARLVGQQVPPLVPRLSFSLLQRLWLLGHNMGHLLLQAWLASGCSAAALNRCEASCCWAGHASDAASLWRRATVRSMLLWESCVEHGWCDRVCRYKPVDYQAIRYYSAPKLKKQLGSLDEVDPEVLKTFEKLGISLNEQACGTSHPPHRIAPGGAGMPQATQRR